MAELRQGRVAAVIVDDHRVVLIERRRSEELYYLFPGGRIEPGETAEECLRREVREETGLEVEIGPQVATTIFEGKMQPHFLTRVVGGTFGPGGGEEFLPEVIAEHGSYAPVWVPVSSLLSMPVHPRELAAMIVSADAAQTWPARPLVIEDPGRASRRRP